MNNLVNEQGEYPFPPADTEPGLYFVGTLILEGLHQWPLCEVCTMLYNLRPPRDKITEASCKIVSNVHDCFSDNCGCR